MSWVLALPIMVPFVTAVVAFLLRRSRLGGQIRHADLISTVLFLGGAGLLYGATGTLNMADLRGAVAAAPDQGLMTLIAMMPLIAFGLKAAVFPSFFWLPASYHTLHYAVSAVFAGLLTKVGVYALMRVFTLIFVGDIGYTHEILLWVSLLTMLTGVLGAAAQGDFRKILSFHIISQIGYMVLGLALMTPLAVMGAVFYLLHHIMVKTNLFLIAGVSRRLTGSSDLYAIGGLYRTAPLLAALFIIPAFSLAGFPPLSGFWAKFVIVQASLEIGEGLVAGIALLVGLLTIFSMTKIWAEAFWKAFGFTGLSLDAMRIRDTATQHLEPAAYSQNPTAATVMGLEVDVPPLRTQEGKVGPRGLRVRNDDHRSIAWNGLSRPNHFELDAGMRFQGIEIVEIRNAGQGEAGNLDRTFPKGLRVERALGRKQRGPGEPWKHAETRPAGLLGDHPIAVVKERGVAAKSIDDETLDACGLGVEDDPGADQLRNDTPAIEVADEHHGNVCGCGKSHVGDVSLAQVDLGRAARAFDDDQIGLGFQPFEAFQHRRHQLGLEPGIVAGLQGCAPLSLHDDLRADVGFGFQQVRVHVGMRLDPACKRLKSLRGQSRRHPLSRRRCSTCSAA